MKVFAHSYMGYAHKRNKKPCQDFSSAYSDPERIVITCCDGHGGDAYVRSQIGSKMASTALINVFRNIEYEDIPFHKEGEFVNKIKLDVLCEWNRLVEYHLGKHPIRKSETRGNEKIHDILKDNPVRAYGTTLAGALIIKNKAIVVGIGDTEIIGIKDGNMIRVLEADDDPAANITYSMCQEDAFTYLRAKILHWKDFDGVMLCTDGLSGPYQSYLNFNESFIKPLVLNSRTNEGLETITNLIRSIAESKGTGDDVSLSYAIKDTLKISRYK